MKALLSAPDSDAVKSIQTPTLTVSSNFEVQPRRSRSPSHLVQPAYCSLAFRTDAILMLLKKAYKDSHLGNVCRVASRALHRFIEPSTSQEEPIPSRDLAPSSNSDENVKSEVPNYVCLADYSSLFGDEFKIADTCWDATYLSILDIAAVEEGIIHVLYACAAQPDLCLKLGGSTSDFWSILPLVQALLPALRPPVGSPDQVDDTFSQWKNISVRNALSQIVTMLSSSVSRPLLRACAGYLSSFLSSHAKSACVLVDLCSGPFSPWISTIIAKVDLAIELMEDLLGVIQGVSQSTARARAALKYIILALSGHMDDVLAKYKENKHKLLFLLEMLEPFLDPAIISTKSTIAFGDVSAIFEEKQEKTCAIALNVIRTAAWRPAVLPSLESEWRRGSVAPSVLLSILGPHMPLPPDVDLCTCSTSEVTEKECRSVTSTNRVHSHGVSSMSTLPGESDEKLDTPEPILKIDAFEDTSLLFAPPELKKMVLISPAKHFKGCSPDRSVEPRYGTTVSEGKDMTESSVSHFQLDNNFLAEFFNLEADYMQLIDHHDCELRSFEFQRLALDLSAQHDISPEGHNAAIDALLLAAECYVNPFFMVSFRNSSNLINQLNMIKSKKKIVSDLLELGNNYQKNKNALEKVANLEEKRDTAVLQILLQAAKLNREYQMNRSQDMMYANDSYDGEQDMDIHSPDLESADAVTLVRHNQELLCPFIMQQLLREQHSSHEILLQSLLFLLNSATELSCPPEDVIDIILQSAENLNRMFISLYHQLKEGNKHFDLEKSHVLQRRWVLLQRLVIASSGNDDGTSFLSNKTNRLQYRCLVPPSSWIKKIANFSDNLYPLPRFLGWMAVSRYAKLYLNERLFLASDLSQLTDLLSIFTDELAVVDNVTEQKLKPSDVKQSVSKKYSEVSKEMSSSNLSGGKDSFRVLYPELHKFFPTMKEQFGSFGEIILEAVGLQLKCFPSSTVPEILCWFSDLCMWPYPGTANNHHAVGKGAKNLKGCMAVNAKVIVLYLLESIVSEHMEAMVSEMPRIAQLLVSLCRAPYFDVAFLDSALRLLQPLISYFLRKANDDVSRKLSCLDFELNFEELFDSIRCRKEYQDVPGENKLRGSLMIFILGALFLDLSSKRKIEILFSLLEWVDFTVAEPTSSFYDYLCAFHKVFDSCHVLLAQTLNQCGSLNPLMKTELSEHKNSGLDNISYSPMGFTDSLETEDIDGSVASDLSDHGFHYLSTDDIKEFSESLQRLISKLTSSIEVSWKLHHQLAMKLTYKLAKCLLLSRCLYSTIQDGTVVTKDGYDGSINPTNSSDLLSKHWQDALKGLTEVIIETQQNQCWQVGSAMLDYLLRLPQRISLSCIIPSLCSAIEHCSLNAPRISWRLQTDKWLSHLFMRGIGDLDGNEGSLVNLFSSMLSHWEPEQRSVALQHLGRIVSLGNNDWVPKLFHSFHENLIASDSATFVTESVVSVLVASTWDKVAAVALSDASMLLRSHAMMLLSGYIPYAARDKLQSFLVATNTIMRSMGRTSPSMEECHVNGLLLGLIASACLYSPAEDIALIPESVWRNLENIGMSKTGWFDDGYKRLCEALCKIRAEPDAVKEALKSTLLSSSTGKHIDPNFRSTRESILQVLSTLTSIQSYFDFFSRRTDQESQELEEAEIEMDLLQKEKALQEVSKSTQDVTPLPSNAPYDKKDGSRLQKIKDDIQSLERSKLREEIAARRQKKLLMRRARQKCLEEAASREMELLQEIDRERTAEMERTIERQRQLELERAKTRELQFNLDVERERQTQRDLQRELEQVESGIRSSRREFSSNPNSRPRERYRERDGGRPGNEGSIRPSSRGRESASSQSATAGVGMASPAPTVVLAGSRSFSGHLPTILQPRERIEERSAAYEDSFEGSRDSGDASSAGDPELSSAFDGLPGGFGSASRPGSRGSKSRQIADRRERDGRREGKWERKH